MIVELPIEQHLKILSLKGGFTGSSESTLVKMTHCWKLHVTAHLVFIQWFESLHYDTKIIRCISCMYGMVTFQVTVSTKSSTARVTNVGFLSSMNCQVTF